MPLPEKGAPWPPIDPAIRSDIADWAAWWSASPDRLAYRYTREGSGRNRHGTPENRPSQYRGGIVGTVARWFWGEPTPFGEKRTNLHMPLARDIARTSADLLYSEPPRLIAENPQTQERLERLMAEGLRRTLLARAEASAALGGGYLRIVWDKAISPEPWISTIRADGAAPTFVHERLRGATFWTVLGVDGQTVIRHLERHEPGVILHGVYEGTEDNLGRPVDLTAFEQTRGFLPVQPLPRSMEQRLACAYIPNTTTAPDWHDLPGSAGLGVSDYQGSETLLSAIDETYTSWMRDVRLARSRIIVPSGYLQSQGAGRGVAWEDREVYAEMNIPPTGDKSITINQFAIRHAEHQATIADLFGRVVRNAGYSSGTFGDDSGGPAVTATEIKASTARSMATRARKSEVEGVYVPELVETLLMLESSDLFPGAGVEVERPEMLFADSVQDDVKYLAESAALLRQGEAASTEALVALVNPDRDADWQAAEVERILRESGRSVADPALTGSEGNGGPGFPAAGGGPFGE
ncbi:capsid protein [Streptomyces bambusae]|uniref:capsid protein n=1 Tax=Streptomyces bambusae TaxID=1550616 RepID=UPI001CFD41E1|nr:capsid protein [Streptomyces bambusae]MCB5168007.1 capsid protein [Streptomyces bambusae]